MTTVRVYQVCYDGYSFIDPGVGDGTLTARFKSREDAEAFARGRLDSGHPARVIEWDVSRRLAQRWGLA